jgi:hypothetical protein
MKSLVSYLEDNGLINKTLLSASSGGNYNFGLLMKETLLELRNEKKIQYLSLEWTLLPKEYMAIEVMFNDRMFEVTKGSR